MKNLFKIAIVGPESTGKSTLSADLANYYKTEFVPEIARVYLDELNSTYQEKDLLEIAKCQIKMEDRISSNSEKLLICDTSLLVIKIWSEVKYQRCDPWIINEELKRKYDLYLLCDIDLKWRPDPLREHPDKREYLFNLYLNALKSKSVNFEIISGTDQLRLQNAIRVIDQYLED